jgi:hypothetical protein
MLMVFVPPDSGIAPGLTPRHGQLVSITIYHFLKIRLKYFIAGRSMGTLAVKVCEVTDEKRLKKTG